MLSYQHHYHIGNHGDVLKHWILFEVLKYMQQKDKPFDYIDTHAGAGLYDLQDAKTQKLKEFEAGISKLLTQPPAGMEEFVGLMQEYYDNNQYPGSSYLVNSLLRRNDRSWLFELHPKTFEELHQCCGKRGCFTRNEDGFIGLQALLPNQSKRAIVLIDPSYEIKDDYQKVIDVTEKAWQKMANTVVMIWYPVVQRHYLDEMESALHNSTLKNVLKIELRVTDDGDGKGMTGSGMIILNPPWTLKSQAEAVLPQLCSVMAADESAGFSVQQILPE